MTTPQKRRLTWSLIKPGIDVNDPEAVIELPEKGVLEGFRVEALSKKHDSLFIKATPPVAPKWIGFVAGHISGGQLPKILGSSSSAVLLIPASGRLLAVTFGYGHVLLREETLVQDFGLKVVLNLLAPGQIKSLDARTFDELTLHTRRGVSHSSPLGVFELDVTRNLLRGITGTSHDKDIPGQLTGSTSLSMNMAIGLPELPDLGKALIKTYGAKHYRKDFKFIDDMRTVRDPSTIGLLDDLLLDALQTREMTDMHLAIPDSVDWQEIAGVQFSFKKKKQVMTPDPSIGVYRDLRDGETITLDRLKKDKVEAISSVNEDELKGKWRVYQCIVYEVEHNGHLYVLSGGDWYQVDKGYRKTVEEFIRTLPELDIGLPEALPTEDEEEYNKRAAAKIDAVCLDRGLIGTGGHDRTEICDILTVDGLFLHIKKRGRSSTLSHLFAQGINSTEMLLHDQEYLEKAAAVVGKVDAKFIAAIPTKLQARKEIKVAYVVLSRSKRTDTPHGLPFFSLVSLQAAARHLMSAGVDVYVQQVKESSSTVSNKSPSPSRRIRKPRSRSYQAA